MKLNNSDNKYEHTENATNNSTEPPSSDFKPDEGTRYFERQMLRDGGITDD